MVFGKGAHIADLFTGVWDTVSSQNVAGKLVPYTKTQQANIYKFNYFEIRSS